MFMALMTAMLVLAAKSKDPSDYSLTIDWVRLSLEVVTIIWVLIDFGLTLCTLLWANVYCFHGSATLLCIYSNKVMIQSSLRNSILGIFGWIQLITSCHHGLIQLVQYMEWSLSVAPSQFILWEQIGDMEKQEMEMKQKLEMESGNGNWKRKWEQKTHQSLVQCFLHI